MDEYEFNAFKVKQDCVSWIREWFNENGPNCKAVIGISGGKDSSVVAALCVEALGRHRVYGVLMPNGVQHDICDALALVKHLGIEYSVINIHQAVAAIEYGVFDALNKWEDQAAINLPARIRMATLFAVAQNMNGMVSCNCNLSEDYIGYSTFGGDDFGSFAPLRDLTTEEVVAIGDACGLPYKLTHKTPADGLCGKSDEDNFGFNYAVLNRYIRTGVCDDANTKEKIDALHRKNLFKLSPMQKFHYDPQS